MKKLLLLFAILAAGACNKDDPMNECGCEVSITDRETNIEIEGFNRSQQVCRDIRELEHGDIIKFYADRGVQVGVAYNSIYCN